MLYNQTIIENLGYMDRITKATFPMIDKYESNDRYYEILRIVEYYNMGRISRNKFYDITTILCYIYHSEVGINKMLKLSLWNMV